MEGTAVKAERYFCTKCNRYHRSNSKRGMNHIGFKGDEKNINQAKVGEISEEALKSLIDKYVKEAVTKYLHTTTSREADIERDLEVEDVLKIPKKINLSPQTIQYYQWYLSKSGDNMTIDEFINEVVEEHFNDCLNVEIGIITRPGRGRRLMLRGE